MPNQRQYRYLNVLLAKNEFTDSTFSDFMNPESRYHIFSVEPQHNLEGALYVKISHEKRPQWAQLLDSVAGQTIEQLSNKSSSAALLVRVRENIVAFTFGYGRFLLNLSMFEQDFGLKTALNTLDHKSLRSIDLHTIEDQPIQRKTQTLRGSEASVFGVDIFRDVLRAVTGSPRDSVSYKNISGGDAIFSFGLEMSVQDIPMIVQELMNYYKMDLYKSSFGWVDNIRRVKDSATTSTLEEQLIEAIRTKNKNLSITLPEIIEWDSVLGFSFTRTKRTISPTIDVSTYLDNIDIDSLSNDSIRRDRLYVTDIHGNEFGYSIYSCLYLELETDNTKQVIYGGNWYEIDKTFMQSIDTTLSLINTSNIHFPGVQVWEEDGKQMIETEGDYNARIADYMSYYLLDKKLVKCTKTTSPIELCDLLTDSKKLIHVKHRKGGSAGLSHLFAQGSVSAEIILGDRQFRKESRKVLRRVSVRAQELIPIDGLQSSDYEIIFLILGDTSDNVKDNLPFFSKVNLARVYENLSQKGFNVSVTGAEKTHKL